MSRTTHNLGTERRPFLVEFSVNPTFDLLMSTWSSLGGEEKSDAHEVGTEWFDEFRTKMPDDALERLRSMAGGLDHSLFLWRTSGIIADRGTELDSIDATLDWLREQPFRRALASELCWSASDDDLALALERDDEAIAKVVAATAEQMNRPQEKIDRHVENVTGFLRHGDDELGERLADLLSEIRESAFREVEAEWYAAMERSAASVAMMVPGSQPQDLIENVTQGVDYTIPIGTTRLVLTPSVVIRPWSMVQDIGSSVAIAYPVEEEHLSADPDAAPAWLVSYYKALGDAKRLKILRRLAGGPADLGELTELLGMAKSSTFHHIGVLRSAGLVKVHIGGSDSGTYELRTRAFQDADGLLDKYLDLPLIDSKEFT